MRYTILVIVLPVIAVGLTFLLNKVLYGDDPRKHFSKKVAFVIAFVAAVLFLPASIGDIRTSLSEWRRCIAERSLSCLMAENTQLTPSALPSERTDGKNPVRNRWTIVAQPQGDHRYSSDLLLTQTGLQLGFACNYRAANVMLIFLSESVRSAVFPEGRAPASMRVFFNFQNSKRAVPIDLVHADPQENENTVYYTNWRSTDEFQIGNLDRVLRSGLENEEDFSVSIEHGSVLWESGIYDMEGASGYWLEANADRKGVPASNSQLCNSLATR
ncbi:hypothetical protein [Roseobacter sp. A03A-229]